VRGPRLIRRKTPATPLFLPMAICGAALPFLMNTAGWLPVAA
jgi:hypothetical protein